MAFWSIKYITLVSFLQQDCIKLLTTKKERAHAHYSHDSKYFRIMTMSQLSSRGFLSLYSNRRQIMLYV